MAVHTIMISQGPNDLVFDPFMCFVDRTQNDPSHLLFVLDESCHGFSFSSDSAPEFAWDDDPAAIGHIFDKAQVLAGGKILRINNRHVINNNSAGYWPYRVLFKEISENCISPDAAPGPQRKQDRTEKHPVIINR